MYWPTFAFLGISIHAPSRERRFVSFLCPASGNFNPRSLAGATFKKRQNFLPLPFQSTLPRGSDSRQMVAKKIFSEFQSTLPRGSDALCVVNFGDPLISIHAPSRERQKETPATADYANISIHAPSRERQKACIRFKSSAPFQSTLPRGSD